MYNRAGPQRKCRSSWRIVRWAQGPDLGWQVKVTKRSRISAKWQIEHLGTAGGMTQLTSGETLSSDSQPRLWLIKLILAFSSQKLIAEAEPDKG